MIAVLVSFLFGIFQAVILKKLLEGFTSGNYTGAVAILIIKLVLYGIAAAVVAFVIPDSIIDCAIGYSLGLPIAVAVQFFYKSLIGKSSSSGDGNNENNNDN